MILYDFWICYDMFGWCIMVIPGVGVWAILGNRCEVGSGNGEVQAETDRQVVETSVTWPFTSWGWKMQCNDLKCMDMKDWIFDGCRFIFSHFSYFSQQLITVWLVTVQVWFAAVIVAVLCLLRGCCDLL